jgi:hypothetical protein
MSKPKLIKCKACGHEISEKATSCPSCGNPNKPSNYLSGGQVLFYLGLGLAVIWWMGSRSISTPSAPMPISAPKPPSAPVTSAPVETKSPIVPTTPKPGAQWAYRREEDEMSKGSNSFATVKSTNQVEFGFPYAGKQNGTLLLRTHVRHGKDVLFSIERGQLLCPSYQGCKVLVRFDDGEARKFSAAGPSDNSSEVLFIQDYSTFVGAMLKAKKVRISPEIFQQGSPVFEFDVSGFDVEKYKGTK